MSNFDLLTCFDITVVGSSFEKIDAFQDECSKEALSAFCLRSRPLLNGIGLSSKIQPNSVSIAEDIESATGVARLRIESQTSRCVETNK